MNLIDRYLAEVERRLPVRKRADVIAELRSSLNDALERKATGSATEEDIVAVLRELGPPAAVAASYNPAPQHLIGPAWFPIFKIVTKICLLGYAIALVVQFAIHLFVAQRGDSLRGIVGGTVESVVWTIGVIVLSFHLLERLNVPLNLPVREWDPRRLPEPAPPGDRVSLLETIVSFIISAVFLVFLVRIGRSTGLPEVAFLPILNEVFRETMNWFYAAALANLAYYALLLWHTRKTAFTRLASLAAGAVGAWACLRIALGLQVRQSDLVAAGLPPAIALIAITSVFITALGIFAIAIWDAAQGLSRGGKSTADTTSALPTC